MSFLYNTIKLYKTNRLAVILLACTFSVPTLSFADDNQKNYHANAHQKRQPSNALLTPEAQNLSQSQEESASYPPTYPTYPPLSTQSGDKAARIKHGEYLVKMGDCISCHTDHKNKGASFAGGVPLATPFGTFYSPNITPDIKTGIGAWSEADFIRSLKEGRTPDGHFYFPVFPYVYFANVTDDDARDMYAYFMDIPAVENEKKSLPFPFNAPGARYSLLGWNLLFFYPNPPLLYDKTQSSQWSRGKYIVDGLGHCSMCHTPLNPLGSPKSRYYLSGGFIDGYWAPNITKDGLKSSTVDEVARVFSTSLLCGQAGPVAGPMSEVNHNSLMYLTDEDHTAIATYLKSVVSEDALSLPPSEASPTLARGRQVYQKACIVCHQDGAMSAPIIGNGPSWYERLKDNTIEGLYQHAIKGYNSMPIKGACVTCSDNDIISAVDYILNASLSRSEWLNLKSAQNNLLNNKARAHHAE